LEGVEAEPAWLAWSPERVAAAYARIAGLLEPFTRMRSPNEAETERQLIDPVLQVLGWDHVLPQQNHRLRGRDILLKICKSLDLPFYASRIHSDLLRPPQIPKAA